MCAGYPYPKKEACCYRILQGSTWCYAQLRRTRRALERHDDKQDEYTAATTILLLLYFEYCGTPPRFSLPPLCRLPSPIGWRY